MCVDCFLESTAYAVGNDGGDTTVHLNELTGFWSPPCRECAGAGSFITNTHAFKLSGPDIYNKIKGWGRNQEVLKDGGLSCPLPRCGLGAFYPRREAGDGRHRVRCPTCARQFCRECNTAWAPGSCEHAPLPEPEPEPEDPVDVARGMVELALFEGTRQKCPKCGVGWGKDDACMHVKCGSVAGARNQGCGAEFCYLCGKVRSGLGRDTCSKTFHCDLKSCFLHSASNPELPSDKDQATVKFHLLRMTYNVHRVRVVVGERVFSRLRARHPDMLKLVLGGKSIRWDDTKKPKPPLWDRSGTHAELLAQTIPVFDLSEGGNGDAGLAADGELPAGAERCAVQ